MKGVGTQTEPLERAGPEVLDQHLGIGHQAAHHLEVDGRLQVEGNRPLVPVDQLPPQTFSVAWVAPGHVAQAVTTVGSLDLDHVGAEIGKIASAIRAGEHGRQIEHA